MGAYIDNQILRFEQWAENAEKQASAFRKEGHPTSAAGAAALAKNLRARAAYLRGDAPPPTSP